MNQSSNFNHSDTLENTLAGADRLLEEFTFYAFFLVKLLSILYSITCAFWLFYVISDILSQLRYKRSLLKRSHTSDPDLIRNNLFQCRERLVRNSLFLIFLLFEMSFSILGNLVGLYTFIPSDPHYPQDYNCTRILHIHRDNHTGYSSTTTFLGKVAHLERFSFSMMIWLFGASLMHLNFAARNKLNVSALMQFILGGILLNLFVLCITSLLDPTLYAKILQSLMDQINLIVVLYISKKKFFPAMNSRVIDAFHLNSLAVYNKQKMLLRQYKFLVKFILVTFELYVFKDLFLYNIFLILRTLGVNSCFHDPRSFLIFPVPGYETAQFLYNISYIFLLFVPIIDAIVYFNICFISFAFICSLAVRFVRRRFFLHLPYRYHILRVPLNPHIISATPIYN